MNGKKKERVTVPVELTRTENHSRLQAEVVHKALEGGVINDHLTVTKVHIFICSLGHIVDIVTSNNLSTGVH